MEEIVFVTHNKGKIASAQRALKNVNVKIFEYDLDEPRSDDVKFISKKKVMEAYELVKTPCISMDSGFWIDALNGFPKAFVNFSLDTIGIDGILKLMDGKELHQFMGRHEGSIAKEILGNDTNKKWSDLWYIYKPQGYNKTLAEMTDEERENRIRYDSVSSLDVFAEWFKNEKNRND